jgi:pimeloyl-ACP methyl ester carboxylesterase
MLEVIDKGRSSATHATPLLFVHGAWHGAWCWDEYFLDYFAGKGYHVLAPSLRGHGGSPAPRSLRALTIADYVEDVASVAASLPTPPVVIGHSMGGCTVQKYLESHDAPAGVLLASVPPAGVLGVSLRLMRHHPWLFTKMNLTLSLFPLVSTAALAREQFFSTEMPEAEVARHASRLQDESYRAFLDMMLLNLPRPKRVKAPLLVLGAENDIIFPQNEVRDTARAYGTTAEFFSGMAHDMMLEAGWQAVADRILNWLKARGL